MLEFAQKSHQQSMKNHRKSSQNDPKPYRNQPLKEKKIRPNTESKKEREQLQRSADVNLLKFNAEPS